MQKEQSEQIIAVALLGLGAGLAVGATVVYFAAKKDIAILEKKLSRSDLFRRTYASWASKAIDKLGREEFNAIAPDLSSDIMFLTLTQDLDK